MLASTPLAQHVFLLVGSCRAGPVQCVGFGQNTVACRPVANADAHHDDAS